MALKSETLLQTPPLVLGGTTKNVLSDEKPSVEEDLEDGEIFDDEDVNENEVAVPSNSSKQQSADSVNKSTTSVTGNCDNKNKDNGAPDSTTMVAGKTTILAAADSNNSILKNDLGGFLPWKNQSINVTSTLDGLEKKLNSQDDEKRSSRDKKKKRKRLKDGDDEKHSKEKRAKKNSDKEAMLSNTNDLVDHNDDNRQPPEEGMDDDDEMLFIRGASPTMNHYNNRHHRSSRDEDDERLQEDDGDNDDFMDDEDDYDDDDCEENGEKKRLRLGDHLGRLDRAARRERLSARGKRRGRGGGVASREGGNKRRKDDGEICIFYLQGKCQKGGECPFSHDAMPHKKMELCKFYLMDCCNKKDKCLYMHSEFPCKYYHMGLKCYANKNCRFSHGKLSDAMRQVFIKTFGPINNRGNKEFPNKKGTSSKHRQQDGSSDFPRVRDARRGSEGNKRGGGAGGVSGPGGPEKKIPSLFDIKVSIPTEMRNNANNMNNHSDSDGNHTPMPSPPHMQHMSDSSRSPPPLAMSPTTQTGRKRKKERKGDRIKKGGDRHRGDRNEIGNKRLPLMMMNNDTNWDEIMMEHQRLQQQFLAESCGNFAEDSDHNDNDDEQCRSNSNQFFIGHQDNHSISDINIGKIHSIDDSGVSDSMPFSQRSPSPQNDSDTGGALHIATQSNDSSNEMFPAHLPKKQRELFLRIKQQQRQAEDSGNSGGGRLQVAEDGEEDGNENNSMTNDRTDSSVPSNGDNKNKMNDNYDSKLKQHDENWYSSDEEDDQQTSNTNSFSAILQNLVRLNSNSGNESPSSQMTGQSNLNSIFSSIQSSTSATTSLTSTVVSSSSTTGVSNINPVGISNVDIDVNEVSELLSKVRQHIQTSTSEKKVRDPRLSRSDVGPSGENPSGVSNALNSTIPTSFSASQSLNQSHVSSVVSNDDVDLRVNASNNRGAGAGDMDLRNLPFKPAPVHSAATEIDASINSHSPLPYKLIPVVVAKPDYSSIQPNSKVLAADPRLRKSLKVSEDLSSVVSSRDPRHRLIDNKEKTNAPAVQNSDPRQRARANSTAVTAMNPMNIADEPQLPPSLMLPPHLRGAFPMMQTPGPGTGPVPDMGMMCPPTPRLEDEPPPNYMPSMPTRPTDPRQRHSQVNMNLPTAQQLAPSLFDAINALQNVRQPNFLSQTGDPRSRPPGIPNMPNIVFPGTVRSNDPVNRGQFGFK